MTVGKRIAKLRKERKLSQPDICRELALMGITMFNNDIYKIELVGKISLFFVCSTVCSNRSDQ